MSRARNGDSHAFGQLVSQHRNQIWAVCFRITGNKCDAEDAMQNALIAAWQNLEKFRGDARFGTWLQRIASNAALTIVRSRKDTEFDHTEIDLADTTRRHDDQIADRDLINQALQQLTEDNRTILVLREYSGLSYTEIADHLGVTTDTVKARLKRTRAQLATMLLTA
ncbi:sigma-70 family RNA polymerase sigma factor [Hoyosella rhizosphaerae]|nr:sigma-70 family RNA polymerase sigma factor [Hoyosella rhizosphaerae]